jgi:vacuolar protein sorting-associated protein 3
MEKVYAYHELRYTVLYYLYILDNEFILYFFKFSSLCDGDLKDDYFPGFSFVVEKLAQLNDHQLVWQYVDWAMSKQQSKAVEIFTKRSNDELTSERMRTETILEYLQNFKEALAIYLEHLIYTKNIKVRLN